MSIFTLIMTPAIYINEQWILNFKQAYYLKKLMLLGVCFRNGISVAFSESNNF